MISLCIQSSLLVLMSQNINGKYLTWILISDFVAARLFCDMPNQYKIYYDLLDVGDGLSIADFMLKCNKEFKYAISLSLSALFKAL